MGLRIFSLCLPMVAIIVARVSAAYPQPPEEACSSCKEMDSFLKAGEERIDSLIGKAADILAQSGPCTSDSSGVKVILSEESEPVNGAQAIATCPEEFPELVNCRCSADDYSCQGVNVTVNQDNDIESCVAYNGPGGYPVKAIAMCIQEDVGPPRFRVFGTTGASSSPIAECREAVDKCAGNDKDSLVSETTDASGIQRFVGCDDGGTFTMIDCWIKNAHPEDGLIRTVISDDRSKCTTSAECAEEGCQLTALCYYES